MSQGPSFPSSPGFCWTPFIPRNLCLTWAATSLVLKHRPKQRNRPGFWWFIKDLKILLLFLNCAFCQRVIDSLYSAQDVGICEQSPRSRPGSYKLQRAPAGGCEDPSSLSFTSAFFLINNTLPDRVNMWCANIQRLSHNGQGQGLIGGCSKMHWGERQE